MINLTVILTAKTSDSLDEIRDLLRQQAQLSRQEPGCLRFEIYESESESNTFILIEQWESQDALDVHRTAQGFTTIYQPRVLPLVDRVPHVCRSLD